MRMPRPSRDETFMEVAVAMARQSTCLRRAVGCVLVDGRGRVLSTGYNGVARGQPHCNERTGGIAYAHACPGAFEKGGDLVLCAAVHAEQNALLQCPDPDAIRTIYVTLSPCDSCLKLMLNTGCERLVVGEWWRDSEALIIKRWAPRTVDSLYMPSMVHLRA